MALKAILSGSERLYGYCGQTYTANIGCPLKRFLCVANVTL